jgi:uncharacterized protein
MTLHAAPMPDNRAVQAMMYGPLVLAARLGADGLTEALQTGGYWAEYKAKPVASGGITADPEGAPWVEKAAGQPLAFRTVGQQEPREMVPLHAIQGERYAVYFDVKKS